MCDLGKLPHLACMVHLVDEKIPAPSLYRPSCHPVAFVGFNHIPVYIIVKGDTVVLFGWCCCYIGMMCLPLANPGQLNLKLLSVHLSAQGHCFSKNPLELYIRLFPHPFSC